MDNRPILVIALAITTTGCDSAPAGVTLTPDPVPVRLVVTTEPPLYVSPGVLAGLKPVVRLVDANGAPVEESNVTVTATAIGNVTIDGVTATTDATGRATFSVLSAAGPDGVSWSIAFGSPNLVPDTTRDILLISDGTISAFAPLTAGAAVLPLYSLRPDGGNATALLTFSSTQATCCVHAWAAAGDLVFHGVVGIDSRLFVRAPSGTIRRLTDDTTEASEVLLALSADDQTVFLAYSTLNDGTRLAKVGLDGSAFQVFPILDVQSASIAPNGQQLAFATDGAAAGLYGLSVMDLTTFVVTPLNVLGHTVRWSPDGQWLAYISQGTPFDGVSIVTPAGTNARRVAAASDSNDENDLGWSPDGRWIIARTQTAASGLRGLVIYHLNSSARLVVPATADLRSPVWRP